MPTTDLFGFNRLTDNAKNVIFAALELAQKFGANEAEAVHLFVALLQNPNQLLNKIFEQFNVDPQNTREQVLMSLPTLGTDSNQAELSEEIKAVINDAFLWAEKLGHVYVGTEHLLLALLGLEKSDIVRELAAFDLTQNKLYEAIQSLGNYVPGLLSKTANKEVDSAGGELLPFFAKDLNQAALNGEFMAITGRDSEIDRLLQILARKTKNNPILVGDAGVGKTAVVQGLVQRILRAEVPPSFVDKKVVSLDIAAIVAGARARGDIEERIINFVQDVIDQGDKIVFIDEIHMIIGGGGGVRDSMDIGNILKPYLTNPNFRVIGATTAAEYSRYFEEDPALSRRFQPIDVGEIDRKSALEIMKQLRPEFEEYHGVKVKPEALEAAVELSVKFIPDRYLPDKAIDLLDEAAALVKLGREIEIEPELSSLGNRLMKTQDKKQAAISGGDLDKAAKYKTMEEDIASEISDLMEGRKKLQGVKVQSVNAELIAHIVAQWTKIPLASQANDQTRLRGLEDKLKKAIVGQDKAVQGVAAALRRSHIALRSSARPLGSFLFLGPTGVGKTEFAKQIAEQLFGNKELLIQVNMSEYMEVHSVAKLIGAPPGYVGFQQGGQLTEEVRRKPYSVILFDEIEKAHPDVLNLLLQILEEGELKDGRGRRAVFRNTVVILTSNIGAERISKDRKLGFDVSISRIDTPEVEQAFEEMREEILNSLRKQMRAEIINRLDEVVVFRGLNEQDCLEISRNMMQQLQSALLERHIELDTTPDVVELVNKKGYSKEYGARNIRRAVQTLVENPLSDHVLSGGIRIPRKGIVKISADVENEKVTFK